MARKKAKKGNGNIFIWLLFIFLGITFSLATYFYFQSRQETKTSFVRYPGFGIDIPESYNIHGIDISYYQGNINWNAVKEMQVKKIKIGFAFIKATEGLGNVDRMFKRNWKNAERAGITKGAYHFFLATKSGKTQAENFIRNVTLKPGDLPPVLDIEQLYGVKPEKMRKEVQTWLQTVEDYYHVKPIIYTYVNFYSRYLDGAFDSYPLWAAHYLEQKKPNINRPWLFWQHNERGRVNGIVTRVDFNVFNGDSTDFEALLVK